MRIIAGTQRGRKLISVPKTLNVKPISDRMKQSLFDILRPKISGAIFLDLFAGTGAVGLEALSRNAFKVVFAENNPVCIKTIKRNIEKFSFGERTHIIKAKLPNDINRLFRYTSGEGYDIIFMGPPYRTITNRMLSLTGKMLKAVACTKLCGRNAIIAAQHHKTEVFEIPEKLEIFKTTRYGDTIIDFLKVK